MKDTYPKPPFFDGPLHPPNTQTIPITKYIGLIFDLEDGWFGIADADNLAYDELGNVMMTFDDLDALIVALGQLRERVK